MTLKLLAYFVAALSCTALLPVIWQTVVTLLSGTLLVDNLDEGVEQLRRADVLVGHNVLGFDIPMIQELYDFDFQGQVIDTLVLSRLFYPHIADRDFERRPLGMPQKLYGRHSLEAWGYRLKCFKGDFGKHEAAWDVYTPEMLDYCIQDTEVTVKLYELMLRRMNDYA